MLNYNKLKKLALKFQSNNVDGFNLAKQLNIEIQTESELLKELGYNDSLLNGNPALLVSINKFVICYNSQADYLNYYILHECSHYILKHNDDSKNKEYEADLLTCLILAPPDKLIQQNLYTVGAVIGHYNIPVDKAKLYVDTLFEKDKEYVSAFNNFLRPTKKDKMLNKKHLIFFSLSTVLIIIFFILLQLLTYRNVDIHMINPETFSQNETLSGKITTEPEVKIETTTEKTTESATKIINEVISETTTKTTSYNNIVPQSNKKVKVTKYGKKYHLPDCKHVVYKNNTVELEIGEAVRTGYTPCADCKPNN